MKLYCIFIACLALFALCSQAFEQSPQGPDKCCFSFYNLRIPVKQVVGYQTCDFKCQIKGIIFITESGNEICADPNERWVKRLKNLLDARTLKEMTEVSFGDST
ncbi:C-C motif chemokine 20-like [Paramisgurnus dabryanus]|uniref:C-C motif chemokine 20-like n=1 Tax=Paramisgurnus dabryanus TaxID=90735 RepID=UPI003CCF81AB